METFRLWPGGPVMEQSPDAQPVGTDSVLLASFPSLGGVERAADFGSGSGVIALILASRRETLRVDCVELDAPAAELNRRNIALNDLTGRLRVLEGDLRALREAEVGKYQLIVSNPPYRPPGSGSPPREDRQTAREERTCTLRELAESASRLLGDGGRLCVVYPSSRLAEAVTVFSQSGLEPKRLRLVAAQQGKAPSLFLLECRRGGRPGIAVEPALILKNPDGTDTREIRKIYRLD